MFCLSELEKLMVEYGVVIRAIPHEYVSRIEVRHKDKYPDGVVYYDEKAKRDMLRVTIKNSKGGKFLITTMHTQGNVLNWWQLERESKQVVFYDSLTDAIEALLAHKGVEY